MSRTVLHARQSIYHPRLPAAGAWELGAGEEPELAAHLVSPRRLYTHHGVYVGAGQVIHYGGLARGLRRGPVEAVSLEDFGRGRSIWVANTAPRYGREQVVNRARSRLGEDCYRLLHNNCEHFCHWCLRGDSHSVQVDAWRSGPRNAWIAVRSAVSTMITSVGHSLTPLHQPLRSD